MPDSSAHPTVALLVRAFLTLGLGVFAFLTNDAATTSLIIGAILGYWLREGEGQALRRRRGRRRGATAVTETETTDRSEP